ncbi:MAG: Na+/H+ antiporter subunit E, partial [Halobacteria archaeon]|nr:Na+/H+ antiporter subunit E [Halobacteria archaeon]
MKAKQWMMLVGLIAFLWLALHLTLDSVGVVIGKLLGGVLVGVVVAYPFRKLYTGEVGTRTFLRGIPYFVIYLVIFTRDVIVSNLDVAWRILSPSMPIEPKVVVIPLEIES